MSILLTIMFCLLYSVGAAHADVQFDNVDDLLSQASPLGTFVTTTTFTMMTYIKSTGSDFVGTECYEGDFVMGDSGPDAMFLGRTGLAGETACAYAFSSDSFYNVFGATNSLTPGWHHLAVRFGAGTLTVFVDGVSVGVLGSIPPIGTEMMTIRTFRMGYVVGAGEAVPSSDRITEVKVYNVAVPDDEMRRLGSSRLRTYGRTTPTGYWTLEDCPEGTAGLGPFRDFTGNNRPLTGSNAPPGLTCVGAEFVSRPWGIQ